MPDPKRPGERPQTGGDIRAPTHGDVSSDPREEFTDWDNPEDELDEWEDAPEGYYDDDEYDEFAVDPDDPDFDLSEGAGYAGYDSDKPIGVPQWAILAFSLLLIIAILIPALIRLS